MARVRPLSSLFLATACWWRIGACRCLLVGPNPAGFAPIEAIEESLAVDGLLARQRELMHLQHARGKHVVFVSILD